jgi:uncharacterized RDD family membrane protein YckC
MAIIQITTTQNANINFNAAEIGVRILGWFIDFIIKSAYIGVVVWFLFVLTELGEFLFNAAGKDMWSMFAIIIIIGFPVIFYTLLMETFVNGQTIGKIIVKTQVVKIDGYQAGFTDYFIRWIMRIIDVNLFFGIIGLVTMGSSKNHQRVGGLASGTAVISKKNKINISHTILENLQSDYKPTYTSVIKLSDNDVRIIKENYKRVKNKDDQKTLLAIKNKIIQVIGEEPKTSSTIDFIEIILKDYNYFTQNM